MYEQIEGSLRSVRMILGSLLPIGMGSWFLWYSTHFAPGEFSDPGGEFNEGFRSFFFGGIFFLILGFCMLMRAFSGSAKQLAPQLLPDKTQNQLGDTNSHADAVIERYLAQKSAQSKSTPAKKTPTQPERPGFGKKRS